MSASADGPGHEEITFSGQPVTHSPWADAVAPPTSDAVPAPVVAPEAVTPVTPVTPLTPVMELTRQIVAAHRAALQAQHALADRALGGGHSHRVPAVTSGGPPATSVTHEVIGPSGSELDGQVPIGVLFEAVLGERLRASSPDLRFLEGTITCHGDLPLEEEAVECTAEIEHVTSQYGQDVVAFHAACRCDGRTLIELTGGLAGAEQERPTAEAGPVRARFDAVRRFKPMARSDVRSLDPGDLSALAAGQIARVFGSGHRQEGCNPSLRLPGDRSRMIDRIDAIDPRGGRFGLGRLSAVKRLQPSQRGTEPLVVEGAAQTLQTYLLYLGMHLVLPDARFQPVIGLPTRITVTGRIPEQSTALRYEVEIVELGLIDRPYVVADVTVYDDVRPIMTIRDLGVCIVEKPGTPYCPGPGGLVEAFLGRTNAAGERAQLNEFHMAHAAMGDLAVAMGPEFGIYADSRAPYIPNGDFLFVDRMMDWHGERGRLTSGATMVTEYDSPPDSWYYQDNGHPTLPHCVLMETSLQSAVLLGYYLGATLPYPEDQFCIRNLDGHATVLKDIDLRGRTIRQRSTLLSHNAMTGAVLQNFSYELSADGEPFYTGESLFGYFNQQALATQVGLDGGRYIGQWLDEAGAEDSVQRFDLRDPVERERLTTGDGLRLGSGQLQLVDWVEVLPGGGDHQAGYLRGHRTISPDEWYFSCHFHRDPVMPGSLGVEAIIQGIQLFILESGLADGIDRPRFALPAGVELGWRYRGQILRTDGDMDFDVHIKEIRREPGRVLVIGDANLWKPELRIYELKNLAVAVVAS